MRSWFNFISKNKKLSGQAFLDVVKTGTLGDIQTQLDLGADPNEVVTENWMDHVTAVGKSVDRGELPIVCALLCAGGRIPQANATMHDVIKKHPGWISDIAPLISPDEATIKDIVFHDLSALDQFSIHWDSVTRQKLIQDYPDQLPQSLALLRQERSIEVPLPVSDHPQRARRRP